MDTCVPKYRRWGTCLAATLLLVVQAACTSRSSVDIPAGAGGSFTLTAAENIPQPNFLYDPSGRAFFSSNAFRVQGACSRGVAGVQLSVNGTVQAGSFTCSLAGTADFTYNAPGDGAYDFLMTPLGADGSAGVPFDLRAYIKSSNPPPPTIVEHNPTFTMAGPYTIHGNFSTNPADEIGNIIAAGTPGTLSVNLAAGTFTYTITAQMGFAYNFTFQTQDYAGHVSTTVPFAIFTKAILAMYAPVGAATDAMTSTNQLAAFTSAPMLIAPMASTNNLYLGVPAGASEGP